MQHQPRQHQPRLLAEVEVFPSTGSAELAKAPGQARLLVPLGLAKVSSLWRGQKRDRC